MELYLKAGQYLEPPQPKHKTRSLSTILPLQGRDGYVFVLVSVDRKYEDAQVFFAHLEEHAQRLAGSFGKTANAQHRFEQFLRAMNEQLAEEVRAGAWNIPINDISAIVGIASDRQMYLSGTGELTALFLHRKPQNRYQVYNLSRSIHTEQALPTWEKAFAVVLDGDLHPGDVFCLANQDLQRAISSDDLLSILTTLPPTGSAEKIRQYFPHMTDLAMIVLQSQLQDFPAEYAEAPLSELSVGQFGQTEEETARLLEDQRPHLRTLLGGALQKWLPKKSSLQTSASPRSKLSSVLKFLLKITKSILSVLWKFSLVFGAWSGKTISSMKTKDTRKQGLNEAKTKVTQSVKNVRSRMNALPATSKYLAVAALAVVLIFILSVSVLSRSKTLSASEEAYASEVQLIEEKIDQASGAIIYKDEAQARDLYAQASQAVDALSVDSESRTETANRLRAEIQSGLDELRHVVHIPEPPVLGTFASHEGIFGRSLFLQNGSLYALATDRQLYQVNLSEKSLLKLTTTEGTVGVAIQASVEDGRVFYLDDRPGISSADSTNNILSGTELAPDAGAQWADLFLFANRVYVLQPAGGENDGQIIRFSPTGVGFDQGSNWIQSKSTSLSDATALAVDGTIFVLKRNGQIVRFVSGSEVGWSADVVDPPLSNATDIWTHVDSNFVYVLEPAGLRLLVFEKATGSFKVQYRSEQFSGLVDFAVDEANKTIYLLTETHVYSISASHL